MIILFSESNIGIHNKYSTDCKIIPIVFIPTVNKNGNIYKPFINLDDNNLIRSLLEKENTYLIGFDLDENGEFMAQALKNYLISKNIDEANIIRTPLTEDGYIATSDFLNINDYCKYRYFQDIFQKKMKKMKLPLMSIMDLLALRYLIKQKGKKIEFSKLENTINLNGTSTITFITNNLLKEGY